MKTKATFIALGLMITAACAEKVTVLQTESISLNGPEEIIPIRDTLVRPVLYTNIPDFNDLGIDEVKEKFIATVLPAILVAKYQIEKNRTQIAILSQKKGWTPTDSAFYNHQKELFDSENISDLLVNMKTHPNSIVLAQAIVESGWGSSRFFRQANNLFGIWSYKQTEQRIVASLSRGKNRVYLRKYNDVSESIVDYFQTVGRSRAYRNFRQARANTTDVAQLLPHLKYYSERRMDYVNQLKTIIRQNDLTQYDKYQINPVYFVEQEIPEGQQVAVEASIW